VIKFGQNQNLTTPKAFDLRLWTLYFDRPWLRNLKLFSVLVIFFNLIYILLIIKCIIYVNIWRATL